jgi:hypothetical protein
MGGYLDISVRPNDFTFTEDQKRKLEELGFHPTLVGREKNVSVSDFSATVQAVLEEVLRLPPNHLPRVIPFYAEDWWNNFFRILAHLPYFDCLDDETREALKNQSYVLSEFWSVGGFGQPRVTNMLVNLHNALTSLDLPEFAEFINFLDDLLQIVILQYPKNISSLSTYPIFRTAIEYWAIETFIMALTRERLNQILREEEENISRLQEQKEAESLLIERKKFVSFLKGGMQESRKSEQELSKSFREYLTSKENRLEDYKVKLFSHALRWLKKWGYLTWEENNLVRDTYNKLSMIVHAKSVSRREPLEVQLFRFSDIMLSSYLKALVEKCGSHDLRYPVAVEFGDGERFLVRKPIDSLTPEERHDLIEAFRKAGLKKTAGLLETVTHRKLRIIK